MNELQAIASEYASHGLTVIPALPGLKEPALDQWRTFQVEAPSERERMAMFAEPGLNIAVICGAISGNVAQIDCETPRAFDREYERCHRAGLTNTWIDRTPSKGGHIWLRLPHAVKTRGKVDDVEILAEGRISLMPPSVAVSKTDGSLQPYQFANRPAQILTVESLDQVQWLNLERASLHVPFRAYPRKAQRLLEGEWDRNVYETRSEADQAIVTVLVNQGFTWESILSAFRRYPAAGKFASINQTDPDAAVEWLRVSWNKAREWTANASPSRKNALELLKYAHSIPWRGRSGSSLRAVFIGFCGLAYRCGQPTFHASVRDVAEFAGVGKNTAATATRRLIGIEAVKLVQHSAYQFARRFSLPLIQDLKHASFAHREKRKVPKEKRDPMCLSEGEKGKSTKLGTLPIPICEGVYQVSSFFVPDAFRQRGLGRASFEVLQQLEAGPLTAPQIAERSGRHVQTVRDKLKRLKKHGLAAKQGKYWIGRALADIDLDALAATLHAKGAAMAQREGHKADRLRHRLRHRLKQQAAQTEHGEGQ